MFRAGRIEEEELPDTSVRPTRLSVSILTFATFDRCEQLLRSIYPWFHDLTTSSATVVTFVIRNNNPALDSRQFDSFIAELRAKEPLIEILFYNDGFNIGFGAGHNQNFKAKASDLFLVLNDDIGFGDHLWLSRMLEIAKADSTVGAVGALDNPTAVTSFYGNGIFAGSGSHWNMRYAEGSVLLLRSTAFQEAGLFDEDYMWAVFEDADLSFKIKQLGYKIAWTSAPHEHLRSSSFNILPTQTKYAILEQNRATLFAKWNFSLHHNDGERQIELYDLWSDGIGDVFCALLHLYGYVQGKSHKRLAKIVVNSSNSELARLILGNDVEIICIADQADLLERYHSKIAKFSSLRGIVYSLPFNIHTLISANLGVNLISGDRIASLKETLDDVRSPLFDALPEEYVVIHLESERIGHDGRAPSKTIMRTMLSSAISSRLPIVLIGKTPILNIKMLGLDDRLVIDLQGKTSISSLVKICANASGFFGIDSFPAHVAQVFGVKSAVFFGSILPHFRVFHKERLWPIMASMHCVGCYHHEIEPSTPFCMRRDIACSIDIAESDIDTICRSALGDKPFNWLALDRRAEELSRQFLMRSIHHPAMKNSFVSKSTPSNHTVSPLIYQIIEDVHRVVTDSTVRSSPDRDNVDRLKQEIFVRDLRIEQMVSLISDLRSGRTQAE